MDKLISKEVIEYLINHIILPIKLPHESHPEVDASNEKYFLKLINAVLNELKEYDSLKDLKEFKEIKQLFKTWAILQGTSSSLQEDKLNECIKALKENQTLSLYLRSQNTCFIIKTISKNEAFISYFQSSLENEVIMSTTGDIEAEFPNQSIYVDCLDTIRSEIFSELLADLANTTFEESFAKTRKAGNDNIEIRNVTNTKLISEFCFSFLVSNSAPDYNRFPKKVTKKVRDDVVYANTLYPFIRSGMWMSIKATLQIELCNRFDETFGFTLYKTIIALVIEKISMLSMNQFDDDLKLQIIKKLAKRVYKLDQMPKTDYIQSAINKCNVAVSNIRKELDSNLASVIDKQNNSTILDLSKFTENDHIHEFNDLKSFLERLSNQKLSNKFENIVLSTKERNLLQNDLSCMRDNLIDESTLSLYDFENWVLNSELNNKKSTTSCLFKLLDRYVQKAIKFYETDELGYSRMTLTSIKVICAIDLISTDDISMLLLHHIGFNSTILEDLLLPKFNDMLIASDLKSYIDKRNHNAVYRCVLDENVDYDSFSVRHSINNKNILNIKNKIISEANQNREKKTSEIISLKESYNNLTKQYNSLGCECYDRRSKCQRCRIRNEAENLEANVYEWPLPKNEHHIAAVLFELYLPETICNLRDSLYILQKYILKTEESCIPIRIYGLWIDNHEIGKHLLRRPKYVTLGSITKSIVQSHYSTKHPKESLDEFLPQNGFTLNLSNTQCQKIEYQNKQYNYKPFCTMKLSSPYKHLQWTINDTSNKENQLIAEQINCPIELKQLEYMKFGCFRSGHCLQMRNLLDSLVIRNISFNHISVNSLIAQTLWQIGPIDFDKSSQLVPSAHLDFTKIEYLKKLNEVLNEFLNDIQKKWNDNIILYNLIIIILRVISICQLEDEINKMILTLKRCRTIANEWLETLKAIIQTENDTEKKKILKIELIKISLYSILTFSLDKEKQSLGMNTNDDIVSWLNSFETLNRYKNILDNKKEAFFDNLFRQASITAIDISEHFLKLIEHDNESSLTKFVTQIWPDSPLGKFGKWELLNNGSYPFWFSASFERHDSYSDSSIIHININGEFLINYFPMGKLPTSILKHRHFIRFFERHDFDVQPASEGVGSFVSTIKVSSTELNYTFYEVDQDLIIIERSKHHEIQLIPNEVFQTHLPSLMIDNFSHWYNIKENKIEFINKTFSSLLDSLKSAEPTVRYSIDLKNSTLIDHLNNQYLISIKSETFNEIYKKLARRFENDDYVHIFKDLKQLDFIHINFPRLELNFKLERSINCIWSCDHSNFKVDDRQNLNTLISLEKYLILIENEVFPIRKLLIPYGKIKICDSGIKKNVSIEFVEDRKPSIFSYVIDEKLKRIKAEDSTTAWLYLALLHGCTSSIIPDPFTELTGTKMALYLLESGICWSTKEYSNESQTILNEIKKLSPKRKFYPEHLKVMQEVDWPNGISPLCANEKFNFIAQKLVDDSKRLDFAFQNITKKKLKKPDDFLSKRAQWRNDKLSLNAELMEENILKIHSQNVIFNKEIRKISTSSYNPLSSSLNIRNLIFQNSQKNGFDLSTSNRINEKRISEWFGKSNDSVFDVFIKNWYELFDFSRTIDSINLKIKLDLILSYLAYKNINLDNLLLFQRIALNRSHFSRSLIDNPPFEDYSLSNGCEYDKPSILNILDKSYYPYNDYSSKNYHETKAKEIEHIELQISNYKTDLVIYSNLSRFFRNNFLHDPSSEIEKYFHSWLNNRKLGHFLESIQNIHNSLEKSNEKPLLETNEDERIKVIERNPIRIQLNFVINEKYDSLSFEAEQVFKFDETNDFFSLYHCLSTQSESNKTEKSIPLFEFDKNCKLSVTYYDGLKKSLDYHHRTSISEKIALNLPEIIGKNEENEKVLNELIKKLTEYLFKLFGAKNDTESSLINAQLWPEIMNPLIFLRFLIHEPNIQMDPRCINVIGAIGVLISLRSQAIRCIKFAKQISMQNQLKKELLNKAFKNWSPKENPEWLLIQLELDIIIRECQVNVARTMISPPNAKSTVIQMNMGEGKISVIIPLLIATQANGNNLIRLIVLKSLMTMNYSSLVFKLGNLLNKRVYILPFSREIDTNVGNLKIYHDILEECLNNKHVLLTLPEYCLSFKLKTIELCRPGSSLEEAVKLIEIERWLEKYSKDILDESDEILSVKYQLVYSVGTQSILDGGKLRWEVAQNILKLGSINLKKLKNKYPDSIEYIENSSHIQAFPKIRLLNREPYDELVQMICQDFFNRIDLDLVIVQYTAEDIKHLKNFVTQKSISNITENKIKKLDSPYLQVILLILRGLLTNDILYTVLNKRWKVDYGVNLSSYRNLLQAVPYRAKDVPSERSQFAHPDIAILKTYLTYYYDGLTNNQLEDLFNILENDTQGYDIYNNWIKLLPSGIEIDPSIRDFSCLNLTDSSQKLNFLFPILRMHPPVINHWLCTFLFPKEAKEFSNKLSTSAWDLCSLNKNLTTGFSGTNDSSQYLLPLIMNYFDLPNLIGTTGCVIENILAEENKYISLIGDNNEQEILNHLIQNQIKVLLDPGALMVKLSNKEVVKKWLSLCNDCKIEAAVFFEKNDLVFIKKNLNEITLFETSIYQHNLNKCLIYLDDIHTRGTDLKIPMNTVAAVTIGKGLVKDRFFQACMRMRMLGDGHSLIFVASREVHNELLKENYSNKPIKSFNVLQWTINNSIKQIKNDSIYWAHQGASFYLKKTSYHNFVNETNQNLNSYFDHSKETGSNKLKSLYGNDRVEMLITEIIGNKSNILIRNLKEAGVNTDHFQDNSELIKNKLIKQIPDLKKYDQLLNEEMELEIEKETEEENLIERPKKAKPFTNYLDLDVKNFVITGIFNNNSSSIMPFMKSFKNSSIECLREEHAWSKQIFITRNFLETVQTDDFDNYFLRIPKWIAVKRNANNDDNIYLILSGYEANELFHLFKDQSVSLIMLIPRAKNDQTLVSFPKIDIPIDTRVQLLIFCGSFYFENRKEQNEFTSFVGYLPSPRSLHYEEKFNQKLITPNGYVPIENREVVFGPNENKCLFEKDPSEFITKLIEVRNYALVPNSAHHLIIFLNGKIPLE